MENAYSEIQFILNSKIGSVACDLDHAPLGNLPGVSWDNLPSIPECNRNQHCAGDLPRWWHMTTSTLVLFVMFSCGYFLTNPQMLDGLKLWNWNGRQVTNFFCLSLLVCKLGTITVHSQRVVRMSRVSIRAQHSASHPVNAMEVLSDLLWDIPEPNANWW